MFWEVPKKFVENNAIFVKLAGRLSRYLCDPVSQPMGDLQPHNLQIPKYTLNTLISPRGLFKNQAWGGGLLERGLINLRDRCPRHITKFIN
jgi:hypothetical protein